MTVLHSSLSKSFLFFPKGILVVSDQNIVEWKHFAINSVVYLTINKLFSQWRRCITVILERWFDKSTTSYEHVGPKSWAHERHYSKQTFRTPDPRAAGRLKSTKATLVCSWFYACAASIPCLMFLAAVVGFVVALPIVICTPFTLILSATCKKVLVLWTSLAQDYFVAVNNCC